MLTNEKRTAIYLAQTGGTNLTPAQAKRVRQRSWREDSEQVEAHRSWRDFMANMRRLRRERKARGRALFHRTGRAA